MYHHLSLNMIDSSPHVLQRSNPSVQLRDGSYHYRNLVVDVDNSLVILETIVTFIAFTQILSLRHQTTTKHHHSRNASLPLSVFFDSLNLFERSNSNNQTNRAPHTPSSPTNHRRPTTASQAAARAAESGPARTNCEADPRKPLALLDQSSL
jgi:hypothetical protein